MSLSKRILLDSVFIVCIAFLPWYVMTAAGLFLFWKFGFAEILAFGFLMDIAYGSNTLYSLGWVPFLPFAYGSFIAIIVLSLIKKRIR